MAYNKRRVKGRVLTVDDSVIYTKIYKKRLNDENIDVIAYNDPLMVLKDIARLKGMAIDLVMLDEEMPKMQGHELVKIIDKELDLPVIFISTRIDLRKQILSLSNNILTFIDKEDLKDFDSKIIPWIINGISRSRLHKKVLSPNTVGIIGLGRVGLEIAQLIIASETCERVFIKSIRNRDEDEGKLLDLKESAVSFPHVSIELVDYHDLFYTDIIIISTGIPQQVGESRDDLIYKNHEIIKTLAENLKGINPQALYIVITNPLDVMTQAFANYSDTNKDRIFGTGCILENARMISEIAKHLWINPSDVTCQMIGPHGDNAIPVFSHSFVSGIHISKYMSVDEYYNIFKSIKQSAYKIIEAQGASYRGIAAVTVSLIQSLYKDYPSIWPISRYIDKFDLDHRIKDVYIGYPSLVSLKDGVKDMFSMTLSEDELNKFYESYVYTKEMLTTLSK